MNEWMNEWMKKRGWRRKYEGEEEENTEEGEEEQQQEEMKMLILMIWRSGSARTQWQHPGTLAFLLKSKNAKKRFEICNIPRHDNYDDKDDDDFDDELRMICRFVVSG